MKATFSFLDHHPPQQHSERVYRSISKCKNQRSSLDATIASGRYILDLISDAICSAVVHSRSHDAVVGVYDESGNVIEAHDHAGDFKEW